MNTFDVVIIGGGPGGLAAGIMLNQAGKSVAMIQEEQDSYGGICLNRGCMPTKSLLKAAAAYRHAKECEKYGLDVVAQSINLKRLQAVTQNDLATLRGMTQLMVTGENITTFRGKGSFASDHDIIITKTEGSIEQVRGELIIIATGSKPVELPFAPFNGNSPRCTTRLVARSFWSKLWIPFCRVKIRKPAECYKMLLHNKASKSKQKQ